MKRVLLLSLVLLATLVALSAAKDPAQGWLGYAKAVNPEETGVLTYVGWYLYIA